MINIEDLVERVLTVTSILRTAGTVVLVIVGVIALFIIINTIRLAVLARAEEIEVMRLVGASDAFIRWPFVFEGAFVGLLGSLVTLGDPARRGRPAQRVHGRLLPRPAAPVRLADPRPRRAGDGRRSRARDPRLVAVGPDLPHPLTVRPGRGGPRGPLRGTRCTLAPFPRDATRRTDRAMFPADPDADPPRAPCPEPIDPPPRRRPARHPIARRPALEPAGLAAPRRRLPLLPISIAVVAVLAGSALFLSGYTLGRQAASDPGTPASEDDRLPAVLGHVPRHQRPLRRRRRRPATLIQGAIRGMIGSLDDPFSAYLTSDEYRQSLQGISGQFEGIGAEIASQGHRRHGGLHAARTGPAVSS